jgi:hypothetical protein
MVGQWLYANRFWREQHRLNCAAFVTEFVDGNRYIGVQD